MKRPVGLATRLFVAQLLALLLAGAVLIATVAVAAPSLFLSHLAMTGEDSPTVTRHALEAFESSVAVAFLAAAVVALIATVALSWFLAHRLSRPVEELAVAAEAVAAGDYRVSVPSTTFGPELAALASAFQKMSDDIASTEAARRRMLADLAHELRTPLATLEAHIDGLEDGIVPPEADTFHVMRAQVARLQRLTTDIKVIAAAQEHALDLHPEPSQMATMLQTACDAAAPRFAARNVDLRCRPGCKAATVMVDPERIQQVLANLLDNALRHTPARGTVMVTGTVAPDHVTIAIADTGDGIPADQLEAIFRRFHRVDPARRALDDSGSGLGLTIARAIVQDHGGDIVADSPGLGRGTTVTVTLPRFTPPHAQTVSV